MRNSNEPSGANRRSGPTGVEAIAPERRLGVRINPPLIDSPDDVKALAHATLVHRLGLRPEAQLEGVDVAQVLASALGSVPVPR